jgi:hypothetical protein
MAVANRLNCGEEILAGLASLACLFGAGAGLTSAGINGGYGC